MFHKLSLNVKYPQQCITLNNVPFFFVTSSKLSKKQLNEPRKKLKEKNVSLHSSMPDFHVLLFAWCTFFTVKQNNRIGR